MQPENMLGKSFPSLGKRILYSYAATCPRFVPLSGLDTEAQRQMRDFTAEMLAALYADPALIGIAEEPDGCYRGQELNNSRPELIAAMEKIEAKFIAFVEALIKLGKAGVPENEAFIVPKAAMTVSKQLRERLEALGLTVVQDKTRTVISSLKYPKMFPVWKFYAENDDETAQKVTRVITFIHGRYAELNYTAVDFFAGLLPDTERLAGLEGFFRERGYGLSNFDLGNKTRYAYVKWLKEYPDKETGSLRAYFNWRKDRQLVFEFKVPRFRALLAGYEGLDGELRDFIFAHLKTCDGCGYCTQTDKSGKRPRLASELSGCGETAMKCPLFPYFTFTELNDEELRMMLRLFELAEGIHK